MKKWCLITRPDCNLKLEIIKTTTQPRRVRLLEEAQPKFHTSKGWKQRQPPSRTSLVYDISTGHGSLANQVRAQTAKTRKQRPRIIPWTRYTWRDNRVHAARHESRVVAWKIEQKKTRQVLSAKNGDAHSHCLQAINKRLFISHISSITRWSFRGPLNVPIEIDKDSKQEG